MKITVYYSNGYKLPADCDLHSHTKNINEQFSLEEGLTYIYVNWLQKTGQFHALTLFCWQRVNTDNKTKQNE